MVMQVTSIRFRAFGYVALATQKPTCNRKPLRFTPNHSTAPVRMVRRLFVPRLNTCTTDHDPDTERRHAILRLTSAHFPAV